MKRANNFDLIISGLMALIWTVGLAGIGVAQTTAFTNQGKLTEASNQVAIFQFNSNRLASNASLHVGAFR
jgi:hypothetical protein